MLVCSAGCRRCPPIISGLRSAVRRGESGTANIYFEEGPAAGDGHYLDHFTGPSRTWIRTVESSKPQLVQTSDICEEKKRWLQAALPAVGPRSIDCYGKYGVYNYGKTKVLLHYYARYLDVGTAKDLHELSRAEQMDLDIVLQLRKDESELTVLWRGKPASNRTVYVRGPKKLRKNLKTDEKGSVRFTPENAGRYTFRTSAEKATPGRDGDEEYSLIRHNGTLVMTLLVKK